MYIWKLWRDSYARFLACLALGLTWIFAAVFLKQTLPNMQTALYQLRNDVNTQQAVWAQLTDDILPAVTVVGILVALALSETGLARDFTQGTAEFLFTRPRRRRHFVWEAWLFGTALVFAATALMTLCSIGLLCYMTGMIGGSRGLALPLLLLPSLTILYGIGYLIAVLTRGRNGAVAAFGLLFVYAAAVPVLYQYWHITLPRWWFSHLPGWANGGQTSFPFAALAGWSAFALLFPLIAQWGLERKEI